MGVKVGRRGAAQESGNFSGPISHHPVGDSQGWGLARGEQRIVDCQVAFIVEERRVMATRIDLDELAVAEAVVETSEPGSVCVDVGLALRNLESVGRQQGFKLQFQYRFSKCCTIAAIVE